MTGHWSSVYPAVVGAARLGWLLCLLYWTCSSPRQAVCSHSLVCSENSLLIVGIGPILKKELELIFDLIALIVCAFIVRYQDSMINYIYINVKKSVLFFGC